MTIRYAARANLYHLQQFLNGQQRDSPHDTIQALDVVMRESPSLKYDNSAISSPFLFCNFLFCWSCWPCDHWFHFVLQLSLFQDRSSPSSLVLQGTLVMGWSVGEDIIRACAPLKWASRWTLVLIFSENYFVENYTIVFNFNRDLQKLRISCVSHTEVGVPLFFPHFCLWHWNLCLKFRCHTHKDELSGTWPKQ